MDGVQAKVHRNKLDWTLDYFQMDMCDSSNTDQDCHLFFVVCCPVHAISALVLCSWQSWSAWSQDRGAPGCCETQPDRQIIIDLCFIYMVYHKKIQQSIGFSLANVDIQVIFTTRGLLSQTVTLWEDLCASPCIGRMRSLYITGNIMKISQ
jgi:hypothetical protein